MQQKTRLRGAGLLLHLGFDFSMRVEVCHVNSEVLCDRER